MIIQHTQFVTDMDRAAMAYATPQLSRLGSIRDVTSASIPGAEPKGGNAVEGNQGVGQGDIRRT